jgi:CheY-like chemotaxis protein
MQVVMNLLSNAVKFTPRDGKVVVGVECPTPTEIVVFVEDSGPGIHPDDREKLFQSYVQVYSGKKNEEQGTGLGLAISRRIAEFHDGSMDVTSEIGKGSRFSLTLPRAYVPVEPVTDMDQTPAAPILGRDDCVQDAIQRTSLTPLQAQGQKPCQSPNKSMANWNVMLVEDNCLVRKMTSKMLHNRWGANVVQLSSCDAFLEIVLGVTSSPKLNQVGGVAIPDVCKIDLCLLDNVMPGIMGAEALRLLREHELKSKCERPLRVIMLTGTCLEEERDEFMRLGADYVLTKPLKPKAFETALKALGLQLNCSLYSS